MTRVISVRGKKRAELESNPDFVYVGRAVRFTTWTERSPWANPFSRPLGESSPVDQFRAYLDARIAREPDLLPRLRAELRGRILGCWCGVWEPGRPDIGCHAVVLAQLAEALP
jgi:hypothetical protein